MPAGIKYWSTTAASNNSAVPYGAPEGWKPSDVNNWGRQVMADVRSQCQDAEWFDWGDVPTRTGATTFTITGDVTSRYIVGRRVKCTDSSTLYGSIATSSYSAPNTTITLTLDSGSLTASLSAVALGIVRNGDSLPDALTLRGISTAGTIRALTSAGLLIEASNGTDVGLLGVGNSANVTWYGGHTMTTLTASTSLTTPRINDTNGNELILFTTTASAVNEFTIINAATGNFPELRATGGDANVGMIFRIQGNANYQFRGTSSTPAIIRLFEDTDNGSNFIALSCPSAVTSDKTWTLPEGDVANGVWVSNGSGVLTTQRPCFAEGFFDGTAGSPSFAYDYNFGTITDNGAGDYTLNFTASASSANYIALGCATTAAGQENDNIIIQSKATGSVRINNRDIGANAFQDNSGINVFVSFPF